MDRPRRQRPHGLDRPSRRGRGRAARAHRPGAMGRAPRPDRTGPMSWPEALELLSAELGEPVTFGSRPSGSSSSASSAPGYRRGRLSCSSRASGRSSPARTTTRPTPSQQITGHPRARGRVPPRVPRGVRLMLAPVIPASSPGRRTRPARRGRVGSPAEGRVCGAVRTRPLAKRPGRRANLF
jgi:hypothetical protein